MKSFQQSLALLVLSAPVIWAATLSDGFDTDHNYLTSGVAGTFWDGVYLGAGDFNNSGVGGGGLGTTLQCDANVSTANTLTVRSTGTAWEGADDDGFFLYKVITGDFSATVHVVSPYDNSSYNTAGLQARAFEPNGDPLGGSEDYVSWTRFDQFSFANYLRNEVNGGVAQINPGGYPNNNYWLRMDRVDNAFQFYQKASSGDSWQVVSFPGPVSGTTLNRPDLAGRPMQVGIIHATFARELGVQFTDFSVTSPSFDSIMAPPQSPTSLILALNLDGTLNISWTPGAGSQGSLVTVWSGTNAVLRQMPVNGTEYVGSNQYGLGDPLAAAGHFVVYDGSGSLATLSGLSADTSYNIAVHSYSGSGQLISYNRQPLVGSVTVPANQVFAQAQVELPNVIVSFSANPGKYYWLQYTDGLNPQFWQNALQSPVLANNAGMVVTHINGALAKERYYRLEEVDPDFSVSTGDGGITSLKRGGDSFDTDYIASGRRLGDVNIKYRPTAGSWLPAQTGDMTGIDSVTYETSSDGTKQIAHYLISDGLAGMLALDSAFTFEQDTFLWSVSISNLTSQTVEIGDLALPFPMNTTYSSPSSSVFKHSFISGHGSWAFWMRPNSVGPYLMMTPSGDTHFEYWDQRASGNVFEAYIHSKAEGEIAAGLGTNWRQPNTSLLLTPGSDHSYACKFQWAADYDGVRQLLVDEGKIDIHVAPGMTVPTNLSARFALRTTQPINSVEAEYPESTELTYIGANGLYQIYQVQFSRLGENRLTINYGSGHKTFLEFFVTEPLETLINKRAQFLANIQIQDPGKWYDGLYPEWNMDSQTLVTPDNYDLLVGFVRYEVAADDSGLSRPAYMAVKNAALPVQSEVESLDDYIEEFVWGGLQRTTNETYAYGIYGVQDWYSNRTSADPGTGGRLHLWRIYDYPHIIAMYEGMYRIAKHYPHISTRLNAKEYLQRAYGTAIALFTVPDQLTGWSAYQTGLMNELVITDLIDELEAEGLSAEAATLRSHWEQKVNHFVLGDADLFGSEYSFDSTGFETQQALAGYAVKHATTLGATNPAAYLEQARQFMDRQMEANIFCRGWLETPYYHYGSDYRQQAGDWYTLSYMSQMGGWGVMDYGLYYATNPAPYLRLAYGSYLSAWALMNTGTPESNYGYWYPGAANDGACGGGFEPSPYNTTWLGQPCRRGSWYYSCEQNLGFCGAIRAAATVLVDDPIFGRFCYGGDWQQSTNVIHVSPKDGVRQRFHAVLSAGQLHMVLENDHFASADSISVKDDLTQTMFVIETPTSTAHTARLRFSGSIPGDYTVSNQSGPITTVTLQAGEEATCDLPIPAGGAPAFFTLSR